MMARSMGIAQANCRALRGSSSGAVGIATSKKSNQTVSRTTQYKRCLTSPEILPPISGPHSVNNNGMRAQSADLEVFELINQDGNPSLSTGVINVSVSGREYKIKKFAICSKSYQRRDYGRTRLEDLCQSSNLLERQSACHHYDQADDVFYFYGCTVSVFEAVLIYHWNGVIHAPKELCSTQFLLELEFWKVPQLAVAYCCKSMLFAGMDAFAPDEPTMASSHSARLDSISEEHDDARASAAVRDVSNQSLHMSQFDGVIFEKQRRILWKFLEDFTSSLSAKVFAAISVLFALGSIVVMIIGSLPECQEHNSFTNTMEPVVALRKIELSCVCWFSFEYILRLVITTERLLYLKGSLQIIDLLTILPSVMEMLFEQTGMNINNLGSIKGAFLALRLLRVLRVMRVFRLARYHTGLKQLGETLSSSKSELSVLAVFFTTTVLLFATSIYYLEKDVPNTKFVSIPAACWWCVITITTVGYGDLVPETVGGQLVATVACLAGIIVLAFPITMIIENFNRKYRGMDDEPEEGLQRVKTLKF